MVAGVIVSKTARQVDQVFDYAVPDELCGAVHVGSRVIVPFGAGGRKCEGFVLYTAMRSEAENLKSVAALSARMMHLTKRVRS